MTSTEILISFLVGCLSTLVISYLIPGIKWSLFSVITRFYYMFSKDAINLTGKWDTEYSEPVADGSLIESREEITIKQRRSYFKGIGIIGGDYPRRFEYNGKIRKEIVSGTYSRLDEPKGSMVGIGSFQLTISPDRNIMLGKCMWLDRDTWAIEISDYRWTRKQ